MKTYRETFPYVVKAVYPCGEVHHYSPRRNYRTAILCAKLAKEVSPDGAVVTITDTQTKKVETIC